MSLAGSIAAVSKYVLLAFGAVLMLIPFLDMFVGAMKSPAELIARPPVWIPAAPDWGIFAEVWGLVPMARWYVNSLIVSSIVTAAVLAFSSMSGFALAKYRFKGRNVIFGAVLAAMMFPPFLFLIPNFFVMNVWPLAGGNNLLGQGGTGLLGTYGAIILPFVGSWFGVFMMRQFMVTVPDEYLDSARIDGCSELRIFWQIVLPMVKPALATLAVFVFIAQWNEFIWTMTVTRVNPDIQTIPVGIELMRDTFNPTRTVALRRAALAVSTVPIMVVFLALQKYYVRGLVMSGIKG